MKTVLIADDDPVMARLLELNLTRAGYRTAICREGLSVRARALEECPAVALFDLLLPGRSGLELVRDFKGDADLAMIPIIVITAKGKGSCHDELLRAGVLEVFTKPFSPRLLIDRVGRAVGSSA